MSKLKILDLFSGIGGFSYAGEKIVGGFETTQFVEVDPYCQSVLRKNFPNVPIHDDIRTFTAKPRQFDVFTIGFPCQDLSVAGRQRGINDETRSGLFYESIRLLREVRPRFALFENVRNLLSHEKGETFQEILFQIAKSGYHAEWSVISAKDMGACHLRKRLWIIAYSNDYGQQRGEFETCNQDVTRQDTQGEWSTDTKDIKRQNNDGIDIRKSTFNGDLSRSSNGRKTSPTNTRGVCELSQRTNDNKRTSNQDNYQKNNNRTLVQEGQSRIQLSKCGGLETDQATSKDGEVRYGNDNSTNKRMDSENSNVTNSNSIGCGRGSGERRSIQEREFFQRESKGGEMGSEIEGRSVITSDPNNNGSSTSKRIRINEETSRSSQKRENEVSKPKRGSKSRSSGIIQQSSETSDFTNSNINGTQGNCEEMESPIWKNAFFNSKERRTLSPNWKGYVSEPCLCRGDDGLSNRVARIKAMGNSIVPACAAVPLQRIKDLNEELW